MQSAQRAPVNTNMLTGEYIDDIDVNIKQRPPVVTVREASSQISTELALRHQQTCYFVGYWDFRP